VLNQYGFVQSAIATNTCYSDTGLFNFYIEVDEHSWKTIQVLFSFSPFLPSFAINK